MDNLNLPSQVILSSYINSYIEVYANENNYHFLPLDGENAGIVQNHQYPTKWNEVLPATCTERGLTMRVCRTCSEIESKVLSPLSHDMSEYTVTTPPTCQAEGEETSKCSRCDKTETRVVDKLSHEAKILEVVEATCKATGLSAGAVCKNCDTVLIVQETIEIKAHTDTDGDYKCDMCSLDMTPAEPEPPTDPSENCDCDCHSNSFIWKILNFFYKLFKINPTCDCGKAHY